MCYSSHRSYGLDTKTLGWGHTEIVVLYLPILQYLMFTNKQELLLDWSEKYAKKISFNLIQKSVGRWILHIDKDIHIDIHIHIYIHNWHDKQCSKSKYTEGMYSGFLKQSISIQQIIHKACWNTSLIFWQNTTVYWSVLMPPDRTVMFIGN